ncbi:hypothetical protein ELQ90_15935 [Labedella phragmitis]|uniref:Septum formation-related domain-containing protein n=1 Tax=Labedella phragmitis TaxID=2498849 RepID=A0A3S4DD39_9MICO|nr:septum formation family protein [Labedella phragmitis]RWZ46257.1 hypothetical protein ELQ90_15935 [Labedella phragmitis]
MIQDLLPGETRDPETGEIVEGGSTDVLTLEEGDCIDDEASAEAPAEGEEDMEEIYDVPTVPCSDPHTWEVMTNLVMTDDDFSGDAETAAYADEQCLTEFEGFIGVAHDDSMHDFTYYVPTAASWAAGDRTINCLIGGVEQTTGSLRDAGR